MNNEKLIIECIFQGARTTVDGGWRISFDAGIQDGELIAALAKLSGKSLMIVVLEKAPAFDPLANIDYKV